MLIQATTQAIVTGRKRIDEKVIAAIDWIPPSKRKGHTERML
ncbi:MAG: hypothetical protein ACRD22_05995 [Terriglobia bacterium]